MFFFRHVPAWHFNLHHKESGIAKYEEKHTRKKVWPWTLSISINSHTCYSLWVLSDKRNMWWTLFSIGNSTCSNNSNTKSTRKVKMCVPFGWLIQIWKETTTKPNTKHQTTGQIYASKIERNKTVAVVLINIYGDSMFPLSLIMYKYTYIFILGVICKYRTVIAACWPSVN